MKNIIFSLIVLVLLGACASLSASPKQVLPPSSTSEEIVRGQFGLTNGELVNYELHLPQNWAGKYELRSEGNLVNFAFNSSPLHTLFSLRAFTEAEWQQVMKEPGHGEQLLTKQGIVIVYNVALDNPYTGAQAEDFQQMAGQVKSVVGTLTASMDTSSTDSDKAYDTLKSFFSLLSKGHYAEAAGLYGGSYEMLVSFNPEIGMNDQAALWQNGCQINGLQCLTVRSAELVRMDVDIFVFVVEFNGAGGSLFVREPCCGADETQSSLPVSQFEVRVQKTVDSKFMVLDMPVYVP